MAANYYGFNSGTNNQPYGVGNSSNYGNYTMQQQQRPPPNNYVGQQPMQQQTYLAFGHPNTSAGTGGPVTSTNYPNTYSYQNTNQQQQQQQQSTYNKPAPQQNAQQHQYFQQQPSNQHTTTNNNVNSSSRYYATNSAPNAGNSMQMKPQQPPQATQQVYSASTPTPAPTPNPSSSSNFTPNSGSTSNFTQAQKISNYEKALISAASSLYQQQKKPTPGGGGGGSGGGGAPNLSAAYLKQLPYWKQRRLTQVKDPNKPIIAAEVKAYLYAWLSKKKARPDYNITAHGTHPYRQSYVSEVVVQGFDYVGKGCASNKKDAQTRAAWDFCDYLVREKKMTESELPTRDAKFSADNNKLPSTYKPQSSEDTKAGIAIKKVISGKINFIGGSTLHIVGGAKKEVKTDTVSYPPAIPTNVNFTAASTMPPPPAPAAPQTAPTAIVDQTKPVTSVPSQPPSKNDPVGEDFVSQVWTDGKVVRFRCKLCECEFNDVSARELHIRGRRHKLNYKRKVDPNIEVDVKLNPKQKSVMKMKMKMEAKKEAVMEEQKKRMEWHMEMRKREEEDIRLYEQEVYYRYKEELSLYEEEVSYCRMTGTPLPLYLARPNMPHFQFFRPNEGARVDTGISRDDQLIIKKHKEIYPTTEELQAVQAAVQSIETAFKDVSLAIHEQEMKVFTASHGVHKKLAQPQRLVTAVLRVGELAKGLLLSGDLSVSLVLMCNEKPTKSMINRVAGHLPKQLASVTDEKFHLKIELENAAMILTSVSAPIVTVHVTLTSTTMRQIPNADAEESATKSKKPDPPDILDHHKCCEALATLRRAKWFQAKVSPHQTCVIICRIIRSFACQPHSWNPWKLLNSWAVELLTERIYSNAINTITPTTCLQRVLEVLSAGILLEEGTGLRDPCEKEPTDVLANLNLQQKEDITKGAQHFLRLLVFGKMHELLGVELPDSQVRKRAADQEDIADQNSKKGKIE